MACLYFRALLINRFSLQWYLQEKKMICVNSLMMKLPEVVITVGANGKLTKKV